MNVLSNSNDRQGDERHIKRWQLIVTAIAAALSLATVIGSVYRDLSDQLNNIHARCVGVERVLEERGMRISNLEEQVYALRHKSGARPDPFTGTDGRQLREEMDSRLNLLEKKSNGQ